MGLVAAYADDGRRHCPTCWVGALGARIGLDVAEILSAHRRGENRSGRLVRRAQCARVDLRGMQSGIAAAAARFWLVCETWRHAMPVRAPGTRAIESAGLGHPGDAGTCPEGDLSAATAGEQQSLQLASQTNSIRFGRGAR